MAFKKGPLKWCNHNQLGNLGYLSTGAENS